MIEREDISMKIKQFCVQLLGALLKPFPADMKVHFEIAINHLHDMLQQDREYYCFTQYVFPPFRICAF